MILVYHIIIVFTFSPQYAYYCILFLFPCTHKSYHMLVIDVAMWYKSYHPSDNLYMDLLHTLSRHPRWLSGPMRSRVHSLWLFVDHCVLRHWDRILVRAVKGLISRTGMVSICPLLWKRDGHHLLTGHHLLPVQLLAGAQFSLNNVHKRGLKHHHFIISNSSPAGAVAQR